jgi:hypothetical protein
MYMSDTTRIFDLPTDPVNGGNVAVSGNGGGPISLTIQEKPLDANTINQLVTGIQQASSTGATQLPSRDIPIVTQNISQDPFVQPNYIPPPSPEKQNMYIEEEASNESILQKEVHRETVVSRLDQWYNEIQFPLLIAVLFFLFQLPIFKTLLFRYFPILFFKDGNINIYGLLFMSITFAIVYFFLFKILSSL